jgi:hypothetical protein
MFMGRLRLMLLIPVCFTTRLFRQMVDMTGVTFTRDVAHPPEEPPELSGSHYRLSGRAGLELLQRSEARGSFGSPAKADDKTDAGALPSDFLVGYPPRQPAEILKPGEGKLIKAGSDIVFGVHCTPNGRAVMDRTRLGLVLAKETPQKRPQTCQPAMNLQNSSPEIQITKWTPRSK